MNIDEFELKYQKQLSHDKIEIECDNCHKKFYPLKTRAKQTIQKRNAYYCSSCGQSMKHKRKPMTEEVKLKISEGVKKHYK